MVATAVAKHCHTFIKRKSTPISQISDNTNQSETVLPTTKKKTIINAQNPKVSKRNCFSKAKKWIVKATPNERTEAAKQIVKTAH